MSDETFGIAAGARGDDSATTSRRSLFIGGTAPVLIVENDDSGCYGSIEAGRAVSASCFQGRQPWYLSPWPCFFCSVGFKSCLLAGGTQTRLYAARKRDREGDAARPRALPCPLESRASHKQQ